MFTVILATVIRTIVLPIVFYEFLSTTSIGRGNAFLAVVVTLTIVNSISILTKLFKILFNTVLLKGKKVIYAIIQIIIEILALLGFWLYFLNNF